MALPFNAKRLSPSRQRHSVSLLLACVCVATILNTARSEGQNPKTPPQVENVYVDAFSGQRGMSQVRSEVIAHLRRDAQIKIVDQSIAADAVLVGDGAIWVKGYINNNPRASQSARRPVYGGYLSVRLLGKDSQTRWSYLVVSGSHGSSSIISDLAGQVARLLPAAIAGGGAGRAGPSLASSSTTSPVDLKAAGATFPAPLYQKWFESYQNSRPGVHVTYDPIGSAAGLEQLALSKIDFAASDIPPDDTNGLRYFASVLGAVVPIYNLSGPDREIRFTPEILSGIYLGKIKRWNDPLIRASNGGTRLPDALITVVHRSDGSGTTYAFTDFLTNTVPDWKQSIGKGSSVSWPVGSGAEGNEGIAQQIEHTPNSIGYVELTYAIQHELSYGEVRNSLGNFIRADLDSLAAAAAGSKGHESLINAPGKAAYPVTTFTYVVLPAQIRDEAKRTSLIDLLDWMLTSGQKQCSALGYAPLPRDVVDRQIEALRSLH